MDTYQATAAMLAKLSENDAAWIAADRAAFAAELLDGHDPVRYARRRTRPPRRRLQLRDILRRHDLTDRVLWRIAEIVHEADLEDERYDVPEAPGFDVALRGLSMICDDQCVLDLTGPIFDGLYEYHRRGLLPGREPA